MEERKVVIEKRESTAQAKKKIRGGTKARSIVRYPRQQVKRYEKHKEKQKKKEIKKEKRKQDPQKQ